MPSLCDQVVLVRTILCVLDNLDYMYGWSLKRGHCYKVTLLKTGAMQ